MKVLIVLSAVIAIAVARPGFVHAPFAYTAPLAYAAAPVVPVEVSSQYHSQDSLGQYNYGYTGGLSSKAESKSLDGVTRGAYSYVDAEGKVQNVQYTADSVNGFRVAASNLPVAPVAPVPEKVEEPKPVEDTPEVAKAKADHFAAVKEAETRAAVPETVEVPTPVAFSYAAPVASYVHTPVVHPYAAPAVTTYTAPGVATYSHHPYGYYPYNAAFGYQYSAVAPATYNAFHPFHFAAPVVAPVAAVDSDDTVEVKAKEE